MPKKIPNTIVRNGVYQFKKRIPEALRTTRVFGGKQFIQRSLETGSYELAVRRVNEALREYDGKVRLAELELAGSGPRSNAEEAECYRPTLIDQTATLPSEVIVYRASRHWQALVGIDAKYRRAASRDPDGLGGEWLEEWDENRIGIDNVPTYLALKKRDYSAVKEDVRWAMNVEGISDPDSHPQFDDFCEKFLEATIDAYEVITNFHQKGRLEPPPTREWLRDAPEKHPIREAMKLHDLMDRYSKTIDFSTDWAKKLRLAVDSFIELHGDLPVQKIEPRHVRAWVDSLLKQAAYQGHRTGETDTEAKRKLSPATVRDGYLAALRRLLAHGVFIGEIERNPAERIQVPQPRSRGVRPRRPFTTDELNALFRLPVFTGCQSTKRINQPGLVLLDDHRYWAPIIALYTGARASEIAQLTLDRVKESSEYPHLRIDLDPADANSSLKTVAAHRLVPIHPDLLELGFDDYVKRIRKKGSARLFPDWKRASNKRYSDSRSQRNFNEKLCTAIAEYQPAPSFHSFRHHMKGLMMRYSVPTQVQNFLLGHEQSGMDKTYLHQPGIEELTPHMRALKFEGIDLTHLLPESRQIAKS
ncbi:tyrosine-type recombinase/integrase [Oceanicaulis sp.]|uniref:tyrosine-type recombinase/integrase n=1 Tax=Oceanicaulis sp. TaxID=1924941 RepID=UPI003F717F9D